MILIAAGTGILGLVSYFVFKGGEQCCCCCCLPCFVVARDDDSSSDEEEEEETDKIAMKKGGTMHVKV